MDLQIAYAIPMKIMFKFILKILKRNQNKFHVKQQFRKKFLFPKVRIKKINMHRQHKQNTTTNTTTNQEKHP